MSAGPASLNTDGADEQMPPDVSLPLLTGVAKLSQPNRAVYPYSVIPGGVRTAQELRDAISRDPVVADHYSDFASSKAQVVDSDSERLAYVSYRLGNEVFWTRRRLQIPRGEKLMTDGVNYARMRCANRISAVPQPRTSPLEPPPPELNAPLSLDWLTELTPSVPATVVALSTTLEGLPGAPEAKTPGTVGTTVPLFGGAVPMPAFFSVIPGAGRPPACRKGSVDPPCHPKPPKPVPEPGAVVLVSTGLGCLAYYWKRQSRSRTQ